MPDRSTKILSHFPALSPADYEHAFSLPQNLQRAWNGFLKTMSYQDFVREVNWEALHIPIRGERSGPHSYQLFFHHTKDKLEQVGTVIISCRTLPTGRKIAVVKAYFPHDDTKKTSLTRSYK